MRDIVLDTETTGLNAQRHRVIEVGCVELVNTIPTGRTFHRYVRPDDDYIPAEAFAVHGISEEFLRDKPLFADIAEDLVAFLEGGRVVAHNAEFDVGFLNAEFARLDRSPIAGEILDTVRLARRRFPGSPVSLDALCDRFGVDKTAREKHGALLDAQLLAEVYAELSGSHQPVLGLSVTERPAAPVLRTHREPRPHGATAGELAAHAAFVAGLSEAVWSW
jgi:DNA polymerase-3 subunit epsilon